MKQVWFAGVHCDVGGGYPEDGAGLSKLALEWMLCEARKQGLLIDERRARKILGMSEGSPYTRPDPAAGAHESLKSWWRLTEFVPKRHYDWSKQRDEHRMNLFRRRTVPEDALLHESVVERLKACPSYRPGNLPRQYRIEPRCPYPGC